MIIQNKAPNLFHMNKHDGFKLIGRGTFSAVYRDLNNPRAVYILSYYGDESKSMVERVRARTRSRHLPHYDLLDEFDTTKYGVARLYRTQYYGDKMHYKSHFLEHWNEAHERAVARAERALGLTNEQYCYRINYEMSLYRHFSPSITRTMEALTDEMAGTEYMFDSASTRNFRLNSNRAVAIMIDPIFHRGLILNWRRKNERQHKVRKRENVLALHHRGEGNERTLDIGTA